MNIEITSIQNIDAKSNIGESLFIAGYSKEARSMHLAQIHSNSDVDRWFITNDEMDRLEISTKLLMAEARFEVVPTTKFSSLLTTWSAGSQADRLNVFVDISAMSRPTMATVFAGLLNVAKSRSIALKLGYVIAAFTPPPVYLPPNEDIRPISEDFAGWPSLPAASTSLIVGLGYEREKAEGACEYFDPNETWVFVPKSPITEYDDAVAANNDILISKAARSRREQHYLVDNPSQTFGQLASLVSAISKRDNPVLLPFGPKIFFALGLLVAAINPELGVWYVTGDLSVEVVDAEPSPHIIGVLFELGPKSSSSISI